MSTETTRPDEPARLHDPDEWTYGDPLAPETHDPDRLLPESARRGRMRRLLARIGWMTRPRAGRPTSPAS